MRAVVEKELSLYRFYKMYGETHPLLKEGYLSRVSYYKIMYAALCNVKENPDVSNLLSIYRNIFELKTEDVDYIHSQVYSDLNKSLDSILSRMVKRKKIFNQWNIFHLDYCYLVTAEILFVYTIFGQRFEERNLVNDIFTRLKIDQKEVFSVSNFIYDVLKGNYEVAKNFLADKCYVDLVYFYNGYVFGYEKIKTPKVAIIGTMASGKSTIFNALVEGDLFPVENKACTSKLFEFIVNPVYNNKLAMAKGIKKEIRCNVMLDDMKKWNEDPGISHIEIEGCAGKNSCLNKKLSLIDTPGPNNSFNGLHGKVTSDFLKKGDYTHVVYILNTTSLGIFDDQKLLTEILKYNQNAPVIFVLNKMDLLDVEAGEEIEKTYYYVEDYLKENGVENPVVMPISARAAKIFKGALSGRKLTAKEKLGFIEYFWMYQDEEYSLHSSHDIPVEGLLLSYEKLEGNISVAGNEYSRKEILQALVHTGVPALENYFSNLELNE
ncbi:TPA: dynamin family protein [Bacillus cereus]|nr:dynamin family protein [Bacillus cereus]